MDEQDFVNHKAVPLGRYLFVRQRLDFTDQHREGSLTAVHRDH